MPRKKADDSFNEATLSKHDKAVWDAFKDRRLILQNFRKNHYGVDLDKLWAEADRDYVPHRLKTKGRKMVVTDEEKGWRGNLVELGSSQWQSDISQSNPFVKIQTALSILVDQNPSGVFTPASKKYEETTTIMKQLYQRSWEFAKSKQQLRLFVYNLAKYGWATGRTYPLRIARKVRVLKEWNEEEPEKSVYEEKEVIEYNDLYRENLDPRNVWMDDQARPNNPMSVRDWVWRKVYDVDDFKKEFEGYPNAKYVTAGGNVEDVVSEKKGGQKRENTNLVEVFFYENRVKDEFLVEAGNVPVVITPLPISDAKGLKKLSLWQTYWNLRHAESPYGVGIFEAIRYDQAFLDRIRNMTIDQLTLSIYKMFFYTGTQALTDTGEIQIRPGVGKQVLNPKDINWLEIPGPGQDAFMGIDMFRKDLDEASGITDPLIGVVTGKTAFEIAQAKESALKRMRNPLDNLLDALNDEAYLTVALIQLLYSIPEVYKISDPDLIEAYLNEIASDPELYSRTDQVDEEGNVLVDDDGNPIQDFEAKVFREFPMNLDKDEKGNLIETEDTRFFRVKPGCLPWEGLIAIKSQSLLSPSKQVDKALDLEMYNMVIPLLQGMAQERLMYLQSGNPPPSVDDLTTGKTAKNILKLYDKDPKEIFPNAWLEEQPAPLFVPMQQGPEGEAQKAETMIPSVTPPENPQSMVGKISNGLSKPARAV